MTLPRDYPRRYVIWYWIADFFFLFILAVVTHLKMTTKSFMKGEFIYLPTLQWHRGRAFALHAGDQGSIPDWHRPKSLEYKLSLYWQLHCQMFGNKCECCRSLEMTILNGWPVSQWLWQAKKPSLLNGHECQA